MVICPLVAFHLLHSVRAHAAVKPHEVEILHIVQIVYVGLGDPKS